MNILIASCGLNCASCEAYQATQANDQVWKEQIAEKRRQEYHAPDITSADISCTGCTSSQGPWFAHCLECSFRSCAAQHGVANCSLCSEYPCEDLNGFLELVPAARENLEQFRAQHLSLE